MLLMNKDGSANDWGVVRTGIGLFLKRKFESVDKILGGI